MIHRPSRMVWLCLALSGLTLPAFAHEHSPAAKQAAVPAEQTLWGIAGNPASITRSIHIDMTDGMRFKPERLEIRQGETVRFVIKNSGRKLHEMVIGTPSALAEHAALMKKFPKMAHDEAHMSHVKGGKQGEIIWTFNRPGSFEFACLVGRHYERGMRGTIEVKP